MIRPQEGSVRALGLDLSNKKDAAAVKAKVGVVFQYPERQLFAETVAQDVAFGPHNLGLPQDEVDRRVESSLSRVGLDLSTVGDKSPFELSGGQQRRVAFAGVLAMEPEVLVLDELMAGLDPAARRDFLELIDRLHRDGLTVIMVSHSMDDLANCCDRIVVMNEGAVFAEGTPSRCLRMPMSSSRSAWAYLLLSAWRWRSRKRACRCVAAGSIRLSRWPTSWQIC